MSEQEAQSAGVSILATRPGVELLCGLLVYTGAMCAKCAHGTRATSKRWARCKKCGERCERRPLPDSEGNATCAPLKCFLLKPWCWFNGHEPVPGTFYSVAYGRRLPCVCCKHCRVIL